MAKNCKAKSCKGKAHSTASASTGKGKSPTHSQKAKAEFGTDKRWTSKGPL